MALLSSLTELSKLGHQNETKEERALRLASLVVLVQQMEDNTPCGGAKNKERLESALHREFRWTGKFGPHSYPTRFATDSGPSCP
eukprot:scaffold219761_cov22-Tisochrysis_lutea.AAC.1